MKKKIIIGVIAIALISCITLLILKVKHDGDIHKRDQAIQKVSKKYYEDFLYDMLTAGKDDAQKETFLKGYETSGFTTTLESIGKVSEINIKDDVDTLKGMCNFKKDTIKIYPEKPYTNKDYKIETTCK